MIRLMDKSQLELKIIEANNIRNIGYTEESFKEFIDSRIEAKEVLYNEYATKEEVIDTEAKLNTYINNLVLISKEKQILHDILEEYKNIKNQGYPEEKWDKFIYIRESAKEVYFNRNISKEKICQIIEKMKYSYEELKC